MNELKQLKGSSRKENLKWSNIKAYLVGHYRERLYYSPRFVWLMRDHIYQQITYRIIVMDRKCLEDGQCKMCGCETTALQMAGKSCEGECYPKMMKREEWLNSRQRYIMEKYYDGLLDKYSNKF